MKADNGGAAFPVAFKSVVNNGHIDTVCPGMSLRDYFAAAALTGLLTRHTVE